MKTLHQSTLALIIAMVSTAALGPGTFLATGPDAPLRFTLHAGQSMLPTPEAVRTLIQVERGAGALRGSTMLLADAASPAAEFRFVDYSSLFAPGRAPVSGAQGHTPAGSDPGQAAWAGSTGYGAGSSAAALSSGMPLARSGGSLSGFGGFREPVGEAGPSAVALDDAALLDAGAAQTRLLQRGLTSGELAGAGQAEVGPGSGGNAVPEPATMLLLASGLLGLAAARRKRA